MHTIDQEEFESDYFLFLIYVAPAGFQVFVSGSLREALKGSKLRRLIGKRRRVEVEPTTGDQFQREKLQNFTRWSYNKFQHHHP